MRADHVDPDLLECADPQDARRAASRRDRHPGAARRALTPNAARSATPARWRGTSRHCRFPVCGQSIDARPVANLGISHHPSDAARRSPMPVTRKAKAAKPAEAQCLARGAEALLRRHAADPPLRGARRADVRHGPDRRVLSSLYRPGGGRRRHAGGAQGRRHDRHLLPRPRPHAGLRHGPEGRHGRADRTARRLFARQGRLDAHVQPREELLRRPRHRRRAGADRHRSRASPTATARTGGFR